MKALMDPEKLPKTMTQEEKETMENAAYGAIVLNLSDNVLREVIGEETTYGMWTKLNEIYKSKDLPNRAYVRETFFTFKMDGNKYLTKDLGEFKKLSSNFKELGDKIGDENESFILLNSLLEAYKEIKMTLKYGRQKIITDNVISAIKTRELELNSQKGDQANGEGLFLRGKNKSNSKEHKNQKNKSKFECTFCHKKGHLRQDCFFLKKKQNQKKQKEKQ